MPPKQTSLQVTEATRQQVEQLASFGSFTDIVRIAVDRMWNEEHSRKHWDLAQEERGICSWCGWDAGKAAESEESGFSGLLARLNERRHPASPEMGRDRTE